MTDPALKATLSRLFRETAQAHEAACAATGSEDTDWPIWYAEKLLSPLERLANVKFDKSHLIYWLMNTDFEHVARAPDTVWADFFADEFIEHFAASKTPAKDKLALYFSGGCPFCWYVMEAIERLALEVEMRDVTRDRARRDELIQGRGRPTVPVLWIQSPDGSVRWMPESQDIIHYLQNTYGRD